VRVGPGRLCGHRIIHTTFPLPVKAVEEKVQTDKPSGRAGKSPSPEVSYAKETLHFLAKNRLDLLAQIVVDPSGSFSRTRGEHGKLADQGANCSFAAPAAMPMASSGKFCHH
jgi:hypothetical protein